MIIINEDAKVQKGVGVKKKEGEEDVNLAQATPKRQRMVQIGGRKKGNSRKQRLYRHHRRQASDNKRKTEYKKVRSKIKIRMNQSHNKEKKG